MHRRQLLHHATALAAIGTGLARAETASPASPTDGMQALLDGRVKVAGVGLAAAQVDADGVHTAYAGRRSAAAPEPPDATTRFEYGSITKTFIALLLADLAVRKELALDEPVEATLGQRLRDAAGQPITWADLATHRSGLPRLPANMNPARASDPYADYGLVELEAFVAAWKPEVARDTRWEYSNLGYGLLAHALALRAGRPLAVLLRERILEPLGVGEMQLAVKGARVEHLAQGHDEFREPVPHWHFDALAGAGALVGSAPSLARYAQAACGVLATPLEEAFALALTPRAEGPNGHNRIGLAWIFAPVKARTLALHDGGTFGFASAIVLDRAQRRAALVLSNAAGTVSDLALHMTEPSLPPRDVAAEARQTRREAVTMDAAHLQPLIGRYVLDPRFAVDVRMRNGRLFAQATGQGEFELFALDARRWFARVAALEIHFEGDAGAPPAFVLHQGGQRLRFVRE